MVVSLYLLFEILSIVLCLHYLYGESFRLDKITVSFLIIELTWMHLVYYLPIDNSFSMFIYPIIAIYCGIRFKSRIKEIVINEVLFLLIISLLQVTIIWTLNIFFNIHIIGEKESLLINIIMFLFILIVLRKCKLSRLSLALQSNDKLIMLVLSVLVVGIAVFLINYRNDKGLGIVDYAILVISAVLIVVSAVDIGKHKIKAKEMEAELRLHKLYEKSFQHLIEDICAKQHEFDNHINTIYSQHYLYDTYEGLVNVQKKYCNNIVHVNKFNKLLSKGNSIVLGFLYGKFLEADKQGIDVEYTVKIDSLECNVPIYKLIEILGNLINNAIEALCKEEDLNKLKVVMLENPYEIAINISNECKNIDYNQVLNFFKKGYSEKGERRGYGLYNVKKICEEYDIVLETSIKEEEKTDRLHFMLIINKPL